MSEVEKPPPVPIAELGKNTQFKPGCTIGQNAKPWSIRGSVRYLASQEIDQKDKNSFKPIGRMTRAQRIAMRVLERADKGDVRAIEFVDERIDGKMVQPTINADLERAKAMSEDELNAELQRVDRELTSLSASVETQHTGTEESATDPAPEAEPIPTPPAS